MKNVILITFQMSEGKQKKQNMHCQTHLVLEDIMACFALKNGLVNKQQTGKAGIRPCNMNRLKN